MSDNYIIDPSDKRYGKLGHLWKIYSFENLVWNEEGSRVRYYIPNELILDDYVTQKINLRKDGSGYNWITSNYLTYVLNWSCGLNSQDYFDLLILHINNRQNRPRCITCHESVPFSGRVTFGYNQSVYWNLVKHTYCSDSCAKSYQGTHPEEFPLIAAHQSKFGFYAHRGEHTVINSRARFINLGELDDPVRFYLARTYDNKLKFGLTASKLSDRSYREVFNSGHMYESIHKVIELTREEAANLESWIKLRFGSEYLDWSKFAELKSEIRSLLANRPIANPFD